ncbi:MAG: DUF3426 domain-containing protein, partial [Gammaproteobacteria bacterium]|nr:DUF3426 domain-containing protein [Gammaproteobacteria bacterium]
GHHPPPFHPPAAAPAAADPTPGAGAAPFAAPAPAPGTGAALTPPTIMPDWREPSEPEAQRSRGWAVAASLLAVALAAQAVHHFRANIAAHDWLGPVLKNAYAAVGVEVVERFDLDQYEFLDLAAVAEPSELGQGRLIIETRVQNTATKQQPYPHIFVKLLDRWNETIAGRYFSPNEYLLRRVSATSQMSPGRVVDAQFIIADPGPDAYSFELDICMQAADGYLCAADEVFE